MLKGGDVRVRGAGGRGERHAEERAGGAQGNERGVRALVEEVVRNCAGGEDLLDLRLGGDQERRQSRRRWRAW